MSICSSSRAVRLGLVVSAVAVCCVLSGCGNGSRKAIAAYVTRVDAIELRLGRPLQQITLADKAFTSKQPNLPALQVRLERSREQVLVVERQIRAVPAPQQALKLRSLLLQLVDREAELAGEVAQFAGFVPAFARTLQPLAPASAALKKSLSATGTAAAKTAALTAYSIQVASVERELDTLDAPPATAPTLAAQTATLRQVHAAVDALASALTHKQSAAIPKLLQQFDAAAVSNQSVAAQKAEIAAVTAYDQRIRSLGRLAVKITREENRLGRTTS
jgi:hypothetical protein